MLYITNQDYNVNKECHVNAEAWCACVAQELLTPAELMDRVEIKTLQEQPQMLKAVYERVLESLAVFYCLRDVTIVRIMANRLQPFDLMRCVKTGNKPNDEFDYDVKILNCRNLDDEKDIYLNYYHCQGEDRAKERNEKYYLYSSSDSLILKKTGEDKKLVLSKNYGKYLKLIRVQSETCRVRFEDSKFGRRSY